MNVRELDDCNKYNSGGSVDPGLQNLVMNNECQDRLEPYREKNSTEECSEMDCVPTVESPMTQVELTEVPHDHHEVPYPMLHLQDSIFSSEDGEPLRKKRKHSEHKVPGLCGLGNLGNTCFMNSALQCLSNTKPLREYFVHEEYKDHIQKDNPFGSDGHMVTSFGSLLKQIWNGHHSAVYPTDIKRNIETIAPRFHGGQQQDAHELLVLLLDGLHEDLNSGNRKRYRSKRTVETDDKHILAEEAWKKHQWRNKSRMVDLFHGQLQVCLRCKHCGKSELMFDPFGFLAFQLPIQEVRQLQTPPLDKRKSLKGKPQDQKMFHQIINPTTHDMPLPSCDEGKHVERLITPGKSPEMEHDTSAVDNPEDHNLFAKEDHQQRAELANGKTTLCGNQTTHGILPSSCDEGKNVEPLIVTCKSPGMEHDTSSADNAKLNEVYNLSSEEGNQQQAEQANEPTTTSSEASHTLLKRTASTHDKLLPSCDEGEHLEPLVATGESPEMEHDICAIDNAKVPKDLVTKLYHQAELAKEQIGRNACGTPATHDIPLIANCESSEMEQDTSAVDNAEAHNLSSEENNQHQAHQANEATTVSSETSRTWLQRWCNALMNIPILRNLRDLVRGQYGHEHLSERSEPTAFGAEQASSDVSCNPPSLEHDDTPISNQPLPHEEKTTSESSKTMLTPACEDKLDKSNTASKCDMPPSHKEDLEDATNRKMVLTLEKSNDAPKPTPDDKIPGQTTKFDITPSNANDTSMNENPCLTGNTSVEIDTTKPPSLSVCAGEPLAACSERRTHKDKTTASKERNNTSLMWPYSNSGNHMRYNQEERGESFSLNQCFDLFTGVKELAESDNWKCTVADCNSRHRSRTCNFWRVPDVLIISLKRFSAQWIKLRNHVDFPVRDLDLTHYMASVRQDDSSIKKYDLYAVCNHSGTLEHGHYFAYCKRTESDGIEKWYKFNDIRVTEIIDEREVVTQDAYILFYIRQ